MSVIYMSHPVHGAKVAISNHEADADEENGWVRFDPTAPAETSVNEMAAAPRRPRRRATQEE